MFSVHEMSAGDLFDDILTLEHPGGAAIVRRLGDRIIQSGKGNRWHRDPRLQRRTRYGGELAVVAERRVQTCRIREARAYGVELCRIGVPRRGPSPADGGERREVIAREAIR